MKEKVHFWTLYLFEGVYQEESALGVLVAAVGVGGEDKFGRVGSRGVVSAMRWTVGGKGVKLSHLSYYKAIKTTTEP